MIAPEKVAGYLANSQSGVAGREALLAGLRKESEKLKAEADKCLELYQAGAVTIAQFKERFQPVDLRRHEIEREIPRLEAAITALTVEEVSVEHIASEGRSFYDKWPTYDVDQKRTVVELFLRNIVIGKDDVALNLYTLPFFEMMTDSEHTPRRAATGCARTGR